jgi:hypothetical protein
MQAKEDDGLNEEQLSPLLYKGLRQPLDEPVTFAVTSVT